jgi:DNA-binding LacI/PurR family transcriptional regulator
VTESPEKSGRSRGGRKRPTADDVAGMARVSRSAVSLTLGGKAKQARLSEETVERILEAADQLHYRANAAGRSLVQGRTETIGLVIRDLHLLEVDPFLALALSGILHRSRVDGYRVLIETVGDRGDAFGELMDSGRIDGMIVENPDYGDASLRRLIKAGRPVVVFGSQGLPEQYSVGLDDHAVGLVATNHLIERGRRRIAHISYASPGIYAVDQRSAGYQEALASAGLPFEPDLIVRASFSTESGYAAMSELLAREPHLDAVFAGSDAVAIGVLAALQDAGSSVPGDIAVASVDDIGAARYCRPALTTVKTHPYRTGQLAASMLIGLMSGEAPERRNHLLDVELVVRDSS